MLTKLTNCLICNHPDFKILKGYEKNHLVKCKSCGFVFCENIPEEKELLEYYTFYPRNSINSNITIKRYNKLLDEFEAYRKTNNLIDIGCGDGYFLAEAKKRGWTVYGTEFTNTAMEICSEKGIIMNRGALSTDSYEGIRFDVVTSFEVIEHINYPQQEINVVSSVLRSGGLFYFTTPNFNSISRMVLKDRCVKIVGYPEHLAYYTPKTIVALLKMHGLVKIKLLTTGIDFNQFKNNRKKNNQHLKVEESLREKAETRFFYKHIKGIVNQALNLSKTGDTMKIWAIKK